jgi:hypothetical protein
MDFGAFALSAGSQTRSVRIDNGCTFDVDIRLSPVPYRLGTGLVNVVTTMVTLTPSETTTIDITLTPTATGFVEEVVLFEVRDASMLGTAVPETPLLVLADIM